MSRYVWFYYDSHEHGHHAARCVFSPSQKYLQSQSDDSQSYDIMSAVCSYFSCLEECASVDFMDEFIQCTNTLVELIQGPCIENQRVLLDNGIVDAGMRVLAWQPSDLKVRVC